MQISQIDQPLLQNYHAAALLPFFNGQVLSLIHIFIHFFMVFSFPTPLSFFPALLFFHRKKQFSHLLRKKPALHFPSPGGSARLRSN